MKRIFSLVPKILFLLCSIFLLYSVNTVLAPKYTYANSTWPTTSNIHGFYKMKPNSVDVLFLGSSIMMNAMSPQEIYDATGIRSYNLATEQQSPLVTVYWLEEAFRTQHPKVVVLDTRYFFGNYSSPLPMEEGLVRKCIDPMKWSPIKLRAILDICRADPSQQFSSYVFTNIRYHNRWQELAKEDFDSSALHAELKGHSVISTRNVPNESLLWQSGIDEGSDMDADIQPFMEDLLNRIIHLCQQHDASLVLLSLPGNQMNAGIHNYLTAVAERNHLNYMNMTTRSFYDQLQADPTWEDVFSHANLWGSAHLSRYMADYLIQHYALSPVIDAQYEETHDFYEHTKISCRLQYTSDLDEYLSLLKADPNFAVLLSVHYDASASLTDHQASFFQDLGLTAPLTEFGQSIAAVISPEEVDWSADQYPVTLTGSLNKQNVLYEIQSSGATYYLPSSITVDGKEYRWETRGLNMIVYDLLWDKIVDNVCFNTHTGEDAIRQ